MLHLSLKLQLLFISGLFLLVNCLSHYYFVKMLSVALLVLNWSHMGNKFAKLIEQVSANTI